MSIIYQERNDEFGFVINTKYAGRMSYIFINSYMRIIMATKLEEFIKRNRNRNADLYQVGLIENIDYVYCPISDCRMVSMGRYITETLGMTHDEYDRLYPNNVKIAQSLSKRIKKGVQEIDPVTGLTKYELGQKKARETLSTPDENGVTGYDKKGKKTKATHMSNVNAHGQNGYSQLASKAIIKGNATKITKGLIMPVEHRSAFKRYSDLVHYETKVGKKIVSEGYKLGLAGEDGAYQVDHMYSVSSGFKNGLSPFLIGHLNNLEVLEWEDNLTKHGSSSISIDELFERTGYSRQQSQFEFEMAMTLIKEACATDAPAMTALHATMIKDATLQYKRNL